MLEEIMKEFEELMLLNDFRHSLERDTNKAIKHFLLDVTDCNGDTCFSDGSMDLKELYQSAIEKTKIRIEELKKER